VGWLCIFACLGTCLEVHCVVCNALQLPSNKKGVDFMNRNEIAHYGFSIVSDEVYVFVNHT